MSWGLGFIPHWQWKQKLLQYIIIFYTVPATGKPCLPLPWQYLCAHSEVLWTGQFNDPQLPWRHQGLCFQSFILRNHSCDTSAEDTDTLAEKNNIFLCTWFALCQKEFAAFSHIFVSLGFQATEGHSDGNRWAKIQGWLSCSMNLTVLMKTDREAKRK